MTACPLEVRMIDPKGACALFTYKRDTDMNRWIIAALLVLSCLDGQTQPQADQRIPADKDLVTYRPRHTMYRRGWIDFNKNGIKDTYEDPTATVEARVEDLLSRMTMEEKTCQMVTLYGYKRVLNDDLPTPEWKNKLWKDGMGAIDEHLNGFQQWGLPPSDNPFVWPASRHAWAMNEVQRFFVEETRLGIPADFTNEGIRGVESYMATNFPTQLGLGHTWDRELINRVGRITGREARLLGYTNVYAPVLDVGRDQRWGRYEEVYGESPYLVAELGVAMARGMQQDMQVAATAKHFIAYSNNKGAREGFARVDPQMSPREIENIHAYTFARVIREAGILGVMSSYNDYDGFPIQSSHYWLTTRLRGDMGFRGYVVSDSDALEYLYSKHRTAPDMKEAVRQAIEAGLNVRCTFRSPESFVMPLRELIREGAISMNTIDDRVRDILRVKFLVGLFDHPYQTDLRQADVEVNGQENRAVALQASRESIVLLKNAGQTLPLDLKAVRRIAVCGPNADESSFVLTHYGPLAVDVTTVLEGIRGRVGDSTEVLYTKGCDLVDANWPESEIISYPLTRDEQAEIDRAVENASRSDVAVVVLGGGQRTCGENKSRTSLDLPGRQQDLLQAVVATGKPVVLVLINGRPLSINWADRFVPAILEAWYPGAYGGQAIAEVLFGDYNPGGKLTVTFPKTVGQIPFNFPYKPASQVNGGTNPGLRGNQSRINGPLYPFGYGLSYTTFEYSDIALSAPAITDKQELTVSCRVKNTGRREGDEVVQLYIRDDVSSVTTYEKSLRGFERIHLLPGESKEVTFTILPRDLQLLNADNHWVVEPGTFTIMIGASSADIRLKGVVEVVPYGSASLMQKSAQEGMADKPVSKLYPVVAGNNDPTAGNVLDKDISTGWSGKSGDYLTFAMNEEARTNEISILWANATGAATFEVQLSGGGGQFLTVYRGKVPTDGNPAKVKFRGTTASDLRILLTAGSASIMEATVPNLRVR